MPGVEFADGSIGFTENSGGNELASTETTAFTLVFEFAILASLAEPQPMPKLNATIEGINNFFISNNITSYV